MAETAKPTAEKTQAQATAEKVFAEVKHIQQSSSSRGSVKSHMGEILAALACPEEVRKFISADAAYKAESETRSKEQIETDEKKAEKKAHKNYNVRTPYLNLEINGIQIFESPLCDVKLPAEGGKLLWDTESTYSEYNSSFKSLSLTAPLGGEIGTIQGSLELFTKDPVNFLQAIFFPKAEDAEAYGGMPIATLKYGWTIATGIPGEDNDDGVKQLVSNPVKLMITDFGMSDVSSLGVTVKFTLMDTGSCLAKNSAGCLGVQADYPQQQLRFILENLLKLRLFTLDDFYYLDTLNSTSASKPTTGTATSQTTFVNPINKPMRLNGNLLFLAIEYLTSVIRERFSFYSNEQFKDKVEKGTQVNKEFANARKALKELEEALNSGLKEGTSEDYKNLEEYQKQINDTQDELVYSCNLVWVPTIPAGWKTSSGYAGENNEEGAYVLLPDPTSLLDVDSTALPVIFGPGASSYPYLFASAQNIVNYQEEPSATWGDVLGINVDYNSLMAQMLADTSETQSFANDLERQSSFKGKLANTPQSTKTSGTVIRPNNGRPPNMPPAEERKNAAMKNVTDKRSEWLPKNAGIRFRGSVAGRNTNKSDDVDLSTKAISDREAGKNRSSANMNRHSSSEAMLKLRSKVSTFLNWPHNISISVLGDPSLMHQGAGLFELVAYYPVETPEGVSVDHTFNHFLSGMYMVTQVTHNLSAGGFTTELQGTLVPAVLAIGERNLDNKDSVETSGIVNYIDATATTRGKEEQFGQVQRISAEELTKKEVTENKAFNKILDLYKQKRTNDPI